MNGITNRIIEQKNKRGAIILAHNYQRPEVQNISDFNGDSLELARRASELEEDVVVFCGVHFMAETAALLSPEKTVLLPDAHAGCPMAEMAEATDVLELKKKYPDAVVVCYVNSTAGVKAVSDVCCTSANAVEVVNRIPENRKIIFVPDKYLGGHVRRMTGRDIVLFNGYCPTHASIQPEHVAKTRKEHPEAKVLVHPECTKDVCLAADEVLSTGQMCSYAQKSDASTIAIGTEVGLLHRLKLENPEKRFVPLLESAVCHDMKKTDLEKIHSSLLNLQPRIKVEGKIAEQAKRAILAMLDEGPIQSLLPEQQA